MPGSASLTVFRHFSTKPALAEAALIRHFDVLNEQASALAASPDAGPALRTLIHIMIETGATKLTLASLLADGTFPPTVRNVSDALRSTVCDVLNRAAAAGEIRRDVTVDEVYLLARGLTQACDNDSTPHR